MESHLSPIHIYQCGKAVEKVFIDLW